MKKYFITLLSVLLNVAALAQHGGMQTGNMLVKTAQLPFYQHIGGKAIYHLYLADTMANFTGKHRPAMAVNGTIPAPVLDFTEGDTAVIYVHNNMMMETSVHWHGLILPNRMDGVSYLTTSPIMPGDTYKFEFPLVQHGTYWYHSHTMTQQQSGLYGAFVIHPRAKPTMPEYTLVLSDWTDENPDEVERMLHTANDWFAIEKSSTQDYLAAARSGNFKTKLDNEWKRMTAMDVSDVYYNRFLSNGKPQNFAPQFKAGDKVHLRIVGGGSSTYFWLTYAGGKIEVVANDGKNLRPVMVDRLIIAAAETYDVVVTIPSDGSYDFLATAEDRSGSTSLWLGSGAKHACKPLPKLKYFEGMKMMNGMMGMDGNMKPMEGMEMANQQMDMNTVMYPEISGSSASSAAMPMDTIHTTGDMKDHQDIHGMKPMSSGKKMEGMNMPGMNDNNLVTLNYGMLKSVEKTTLPPGPVKNLYFELTGNMNRYVWTINNKTVSEADKILIKKGENVRIVLYNNTMMRHPMHLHGHFFRLLNGQGEYSPLKNTLDIMPMERDTIEFRASESGDWFFHCHILYHMMSGMGRIFSYENSPPNPDIPDPAQAIKKVYADDRRYYATARLGLESNGSDATASLDNTRWKFSTLWHLGLNDRSGYESETMAGRYFGKMQWLYAYAGFDFHYQKINAPEHTLLGQVSDKHNRHTVVAGLAYTLPMLFVADARIDGNGKVRLQLGRDDIPLTSRLRLTLMGNTDKEYSAGLRYITAKNLSLSTHYDSDMGYGAGVTLVY